MGELRVYAVDPAVGRYRSLLVDLPEEEVRTIPWRATDGEDWPAPPVSIADIEAPSPDIWFLVTTANAFVFSPESVERLEPFLSMAGDLLPLGNSTGEDREFIALNLTNRRKLNESVDVWNGYEERVRLLKRGLERVGGENAAELLALAAAGDPYPYLLPAFITEGLGDAQPTFFRLDRLAGTIFLLDREDDEDTLLRRIKRLGLTGLDFECVWSSATGPRNVNLFRRGRAL